MKVSEKYNRVSTGIIAGVVVPVIVMLIFCLWQADRYTVKEFISRLISYGVLTNVISVSVFANVFFFLLFNRFDMLKASKGILGVTIIWAIVVFIIKLT